MIRFYTKHYPSVVMHDKVATKLIHLMGLSEVMPNAIEGEVLNEALEKLKQFRAQSSEGTSPVSDDKEVDDIHRADPLIKLMATAQDNQNHVMWEPTHFF
jgi:hypothetical protein